MVQFPLQVVGPKKEKLAEAEAELAVQMGKLNEKRAELKEVINALRAEYIRLLKAK